MNDRTAQRRAKIRALLATRLQDQPLLQPKQIQRLLGCEDVDLRTLQRDLRAIRAEPCRIVVVKEVVVSRHTIFGNGWYDFDL